MIKIIFLIPFLLVSCASQGKIWKVSVDDKNHTITLCGDYYATQEDWKISMGKCTEVINCYQIPTETFHNGEMLWNNPKYINCCVFKC